MAEQGVNTITFTPHTWGWTDIYDPNNKEESYLPHIRGDEPLYRTYTLKDLSIYPTYVGMNRGALTDKQIEKLHLPHIRGDEPL